MREFADLESLLIGKTVLNTLFSSIGHSIRRYALPPLKHLYH